MKLSSKPNSPQTFWRAGDKMSAITYIGDTEFRPLSEPVFTTAGYELDSAKVAYQGAAPKKQAFVDSLKIFDALGSGFNRMFFDGTSDDGNPVFPTIDLNFTGFRGPIPAAKGVDSLVVKSLVLDAPASEGLTPLAFSAGYYAARTTWTWYLTSAPDPISPKFNNTRGRFSSAGSLFNIRTPQGSPVALAVALPYIKDLPQKDFVSDYVITDVAPGKLWSCSSVIDREFTR